jgi:hypothetical protein
MLISEHQHGALPMGSRKGIDRIRLPIDAPRLRHPCGGDSVLAWLGKLGLNDFNEQIQGDCSMATNPIPQPEPERRDMPQPQPGTRTPRWPQLLR